MEGQSQSQSQSQRQSERVLLVHDASKGVRMKPLRLLLDKRFLKAGDKLTIMSIVHQIRHPMGYMMTLDSSMFGVNQKAIDDEIANKRKEYEHNSDVAEISKLYEMQEVDFKIEVVVGPVLKNAVVEASKKFEATWVIIDKRMKGDKKYFLEKLSCGISTTDGNDNIIKIRGPKLSTTRNPTLPTDDRMLTIREVQNDEDLFSIELGSSYTSSSTRTSFSNLNQVSTLQEINGETACDHDVTLPPKPEEKVQLDQKKCTTCTRTSPTDDFWQQSRNYSYLELVDATNRFSSENLIHRGENEVVFHGFFKASKLHVVVKVQNDAKKYQSEVQALEQTQNEHVIKLLGTCVEETARLLVFEYACNGSLDQHLSHQNSRPLTWKERIKIAIGVCRGLNHLHGNNIIHGDMRPKNIWLTHDFQPLIAGFGLASMTNESQNSSNHYIIGTLGYLAPEYKERGNATPKTDVYAFGMILMQLVTGLSPTDTRLQGHSLINWANSLVKERKFSELIDSRNAYDKNQVANMAQLALKCVRKNPHLRLTMEEVMLVLDYINDMKTNYEGQRVEESQEVNGNVETIGQSQREHDEKVIYSYGGMTPLPKQAKHFYQGEYI